MALNFYNIELINKGFQYHFSFFYGCLLRKPCSKDNLGARMPLPSKVSTSLECIYNPYTLSLNNIAAFNRTSPSRLSIIYAHALVLACKHSLLLARILCSMPLIRFPDTAGSIATFQAIYPEAGDQRTLCLPRTLFAIATSRSFNHKGVAFIGVFLPSRKMHAWIIEDNGNPDLHDDVWVCYQPVTAITK